MVGEQMNPPGLKAVRPIVWVVEWGDVSLAVLARSRRPVH